MVVLGDPEKSGRVVFGGRKESHGLFCIPDFEHICVQTVGPASEPSDLQKGFRKRSGVLSSRSRHGK